MFKEELKLVPHAPGSYQMVNSDGIIIYVGKAKDLNKRLHSYFRGTVTGKTATVDATGALAGSVSNLMECMCLCVREMGIPLGSAVKAASLNPAKALRIYDKYGSISHGKYADIVLLDRDLNIRKIIFRGKLLDRRRDL